MKKKIFSLIFLKWLFVFSVWLTIFLGGTVVWAFLNLPETESIQITRQPSITFLDREGRILASFGDIYGQSISYEQLPQDLINAVIVTEDKRFFDHYGVDIRGVLRAAYENLKERRIVQGGSTITQQLAKNLFLWHGRSWPRKIFEMYYTFLMETIIPKRRILEIYLNIVETSLLTFGVDRASEKYYKKSSD